MTTPTITLMGDDTDAMQRLLGVLTGFAVVVETSDPRAGRFHALVTEATSDLATFELVNDTFDGRGEFVEIETGDILNVSVL